MSRAAPRPAVTLVVVCLSLLLIALDNTIVNVALPTLVKELGASTTDLQWIVDSYTLVFAGFILLLGSLGDRFGRRHLLEAGMAVFGVGALIAAFGDTAGQLIAGRAVMGLGGAAMMPATLSILANTFTERSARARAIAVWAAIAGVGVALGPVLGGWLLEHYWWGSIFLVNVPVILVAAVAGRFTVPNSRDEDARPIDFAGAAASIAALGLIVWSLIEGPERGWTDPLIIGVAVAGLVALAVFLFVESRSPNAMVDLSLFRNPSFSAASAAIMLVFFTLFGAVFLFTQYLQFVLGYTAFEAGVRTLPIAALLMVCAPASARVVERVGATRVVTVGLTLVTAGMLLASQFDAGTSYGRIAAVFMLIGAGMGLTMAPATESIMGSVPRAKAGVGSAVNDATRQVGGTLGVAVIGSVLASRYESVIDQAVSAAPVPPAAAEAARHSLGGALQVAERVGGDVAARITSTATSAYMDGMEAGLIAAAAGTFVAAVVVARFLPAHPHSPDEDGAGAVGETVAEQKRSSAAVER